MSWALSVCQTVLLPLSLNHPERLSGHQAYIHAWLPHLSLPRRIFIILIVGVDKNLCAVQYVDTWLDIQLLHQMFLDITVIEGGSFLTAVFG